MDTRTSPKESLKIAQLDNEHGLMLRTIAERMGVSNRRALQFCLAEVHAIHSVARPTRYFHFGKDPIKTVFIPFSPAQLSFCDTIINKEKTSFKAKCQEAIESIHAEVRKGIDLKTLRRFKEYCGT